MARMTEDKWSQCSWVGCSRPANTSFEGRLLCIEHFLVMAPRRLESIEAALSNQPGTRGIEGE